MRFFRLALFLWITLTVSTISRAFCRLTMLASLSTSSSWRWRTAQDFEPRRSSRPYSLPWAKPASRCVGNQLDFCRLSIWSRFHIIYNNNNNNVKDDSGVAEALNVIQSTFLHRLYWAKELWHSVLQNSSWDVLKSHHRLHPSEVTQRS